MSAWIRTPTKIPKDAQQQIKDRILKYANEKYKGKFERIEVRFRSQFAYIDAFIAPQEPMPNGEEYPTHLIRLTYFGNIEKMGLAFYTYSNEKYSECVFGNGEFYGSPEQGFDVGAVYLTGD